MRFAQDRKVYVLETAYIWSFKTPVLSLASCVTLRKLSYFYKPILFYLNLWQLFIWNRNIVTIISIYTHINMSNRVLSQYTFPRENLLPFSALFWHFVGSQSLKPKKNSAKYSNSHNVGNFIFALRAICQYRKRALHRNIKCNGLLICENAIILNKVIK